MATTEALYTETLDLLRELIRNACVNDLTADSGEERRNAETLKAFFAGTPNVRVQEFEPHPGRVSVIFTVPGTDPDAEPLTLMGHTDVVPVDEDAWEHEPFGAEIITTPESEEVLYGRGSVDMLFITATMAAVTRDVAERGGARGELTFAALADEEARGGLGGKWLSENAAEAFSWRNCLSETGGAHLPVADGSDAIVVYVGEKGAGQRRLTVRGEAGHGSTPYGRDSAIAKIGEVAARVAAIEPPVTDNPIWQGFVRAFRFDPATEKALLTGSETADYGVFGGLSGYAHAFSHLTLAQTVLRAGGAINVLPSKASLEMDIRPLPGHTQEGIDELIRAGLGDLADEVEIEHLITEPATESPAEGPLWDAMVATVHEDFPDAVVVPVYATGGSDLRFARRLGGNGYGFALHARGRDLAAANRQLHAHDEHLHVEDLRLTVGAYSRLVDRFLGV
ncbi:M20/M25/M40 family metallo-hydrolase [Corynebacterium frankenforstense]